jgi:hypothetical protein
MPAWVTLLLGTAATVAPQFISILPHQLQGAVTGFFALGTSLYHLYATSPFTPTA